MKLLDGKLRDGAFFWGKIGNIQLTIKEIFQSVLRSLYEYKVQVLHGYVGVK